MGQSRRGKVAQFRRRSTVLTLYAAGKDYEEIVALVNDEAEQKGEPRTSVSAVKSIIDRQLAKWSDDAPPADVERARGLALERLDQMTAALWPKVKAGNPRAIESALKIEERRARILGLEKPVEHKHEHQHEHEHRVVDTDEVDRLHQAFVHSVDGTAELMPAPDPLPDVDVVDGELVEASSAA